MTQPILALLAVWVLIVAIGFAVWPLFAGASREVDPREVELRDLEAEKARLLEDLHELELDRETGKLSGEDYRANRARLEGRAVEVMRQIEDLRDGDAPAGDDQELASLAEEEDETLRPAEVAETRG